MNARVHAGFRGFARSNSSTSKVVADRAHMANSHLAKVVEWLYVVLIKADPWKTWTNDIYDAMRCIDHLPIG